MQSRLEEEEEAKAALMSRIQRLTKLILVSSKNTLPGYLSDASTHQRGQSVSEENVCFLLLASLCYFKAFLYFCNISCLSCWKISKISFIRIKSWSYIVLPLFFLHQKLEVLGEGSSLIDGENQKDKWNDDISQAGSSITESTHAGELINGSSCNSKLPIVCSVSL